MRVLADKAGLDISADDAESFFDDYFYDRRQTDHAWIELRAYLISPGVELNDAPASATAAFDEIDWWPLNAGTVNQLGSGESRLVRGAMRRLNDAALVDPEILSRNPVRPD